MRYYLAWAILCLSFFAQCNGEEFHGVWSKNLQHVLIAKGKTLKIGLISAKPYEQGNL